MEFENRVLKFRLWPSIQTLVLLNHICLRPHGLGRFRLLPTWLELKIAPKVELPLLSTVSSKVYTSPYIFVIIACNSDYSGTEEAALNGQLYWDMFRKTEMSLLKWSLQLYEEEVNKRVAYLVGRFWMESLHALFIAVYSSSIRKNILSLHPRIKVSVPSARALASLMSWKLSQISSKFSMMIFLMITAAKSDSIISSCWTNEIRCSFASLSWMSW